MAPAGSIDIAYGAGAWPCPQLAKPLNPGDDTVSLITFVPSALIVKT
jgi:hypothetical protein